MENTEKEVEQASCPASTAMENILRELDSLSNTMDHLACMFNCLSHIHIMSEKKPI